MAAEDQPCFRGTTFIPDPDVSGEAVRFLALDGYDLGGVLYRKQLGCAPDYKLSAVLSTGCGTAAFHYRHIATYLASMNIPTLVYDYRGIGLSSCDDLASLDAGLEDWAQYDAGGAIACMRSLFPHTALAGVAHSIGCLLLPAAPNANEISQYVLIAPNVGYVADYPMPWRPLMTFFHYILMPRLASRLGYFPAKIFGTGENLPARVALQWGSRTKPSFDMEALDRDGRASALLKGLKEATAHALVLSASDDRWALEANVRRFLFVASSLRTVRRLVPCSEVKDHRVGHWGYFRRSLGYAFWPTISRFLST